MNDHAGTPSTATERTENPKPMPGAAPRRLVGIVPSFRGFLYRLPWTVGLVCSAYLLIVWGIAQNFGGHADDEWLQGGFVQSYVAASMLLYSTLASIVVFGFFGWKKKDIAGGVLIFVYLFVLLHFMFCFIHKVRGFAVWPMTG